MRSSVGEGLTFDPAQLERIVDEVARQRRLSRSDAEEAVGEAFVTLVEKAEGMKPGEVEGFLRQAALNKGFNIGTKAKRRRTTSLDRFGEADEDRAPIELAVDEVDFDSHARLAEARDNPILRAKVEAGQIGSPELRRRGAAAAERGTAYPDETVAEARRLYREGMPIVDIMEQMGIAKTTIANWVHGRTRRAPTSDPGWTPERVIGAIAAVIAEDGLHPPATAMLTDPRLPGHRCFYRLLDSWPKAVALAAKLAASPPGLGGLNA